MGMVWRRDEIPGRTAPKVGWAEVFRAPYLTDPTTLLLLGANLFPLLGVLFLDWDLYLLMVLYWMETGIIGFWYLLRLAILTRWLFLILGPFFTLHFGIFMKVHLLFLSSFFGGDRRSLQGVGDLIEKLLVPSGLWVPFVVLFLSHGFSFFKNFLGGASPGSEGDPPIDLVSALKRSLRIQKRMVALQKEGKTLPPDDPDHLEAQRLAKGFSGQLQHLMADPYQRVVVMHLTIIFGGMLTFALPWKEAAYVLMVLLKIGVDVGAHVRKNFKAEALGVSP